MVTPLELAAYRLGIRLTQCWQLHRRAIAGRPAAPGSTEMVDVDDITAVKWAILELGNAFQSFGRLAETCAGLRYAGMVPIRNCRRLWKAQSEKPVRQVNNESVADSEFLANLKSLDYKIGKIAHELATAGACTDDWFSLGKQITDGQWFSIDDDDCLVATEFRSEETTVHTHDHGGLVNPFTGGWQLESRSECTDDRLGGLWFLPDSRRSLSDEPRVLTLGGRAWVWSDSVTVQSRICAVAAEIGDLLPDIEDSAKSRLLLPYNRIDYWPWFRIEAGLTRLLAVAGAVKKNLTFVAAWDSKHVKHMLAVDVENQQAILDGSPLRLKNRQAAIFVKALVDANGKPVTPKSICCSYRGFAGARPERIKRDLPSGIRDLIEAEPGIGSWLRSS